VPLPNGNRNEGEDAFPIDEKPAVFSNPRKTCSALDWIKQEHWINQVGELHAFPISLMHAPAHRPRASEAELIRALEKKLKENKELRDDLLEEEQLVSPLL
jgi:hypothetical protein